MNNMTICKTSKMNAVRSRFAALRTNLKSFAKDNRGEGYLDMAMKILIVVVIGAAILAIMNTAMPTLFQNLINKVSSELNSINVLP